MAERKINLPETKGQFKLRGIVTGMQRENAFKDIETKSKKKMHILNFGVETSPNTQIYTSIQGMEQDQAFFYKRPEKKGEKGHVKKVAWNERNKDQGEGYQLIGISLGLEKGEDGKNITSTFVDFDAALKAYEELEDGMSVFVRGDLEYSSFKNNKDEKVRNKKFNARNVYLSQSVDFESEDFKETADFKQKIIYTGIQKDEKEDDKFIIEAKIVNYNSIEDAEFIVRNKSLANTFRSKLKPYTAIEIWGNIVNQVETEEVESSTAVWGEEDKFQSANKSYVRELVITGADPETIDTETYSQANVDEAIEKLNATGQVSNDWGKSEDKNEDLDSSDLPW